MEKIKEQLWLLCSQHITATIRDAENAIADGREASRNETKSSAGDKYETTREMMQQEIDMNTTRLNKAKAQQQLLNLIPTDKTFTSVQPGAVVKTNNGNFYIAISAGQLIADGEKYYAVSIESPIGLQLKQRKAGDNFALNGKQYTIASVI
ncbi:MAG: 3-oxoacyl-ACP synthase [Bacteroidetes bacterium]|nr:3-oxoacyl-ACP synthase [Bacteroidota bacterium]